MNADAVDGHLNASARQAFNGAVLNETHHALGGFPRVFDHRSRCSASNEHGVVVISCQQRFRGPLSGQLFTGAFKFAVGQDQKDQLGRDALDRTGGRHSKILVYAGHVSKRAVNLVMGDLGTAGARAMPWMAPVGPDRSAFFRSRHILNHDPAAAKSPEIR